jgi:8-oxo-dGTP pyrophosphatase MutT (NUDIX family)
MIWKPHVTVAAIAHYHDRFLMVQERVSGQLVLNQPAGHLEEHERLTDAVVRETLEETGWHFEPEVVTGIYHWREPLSQRTYLRVCFAGHLLDNVPDAELDTGIVQALWLSHPELVRRSGQLRSPMVLRCIDDYLAGARYPLRLLSELA